MATQATIISKKKRKKRQADHFMATSDIEQMPRTHMKRTISEHNSSRFSDPGGTDFEDSDLESVTGDVGDQVPSISHGDADEPATDVSPPPTQDRPPTTDVSPPSTQDPAPQPHPDTSEPTPLTGYHPSTTGPFGTLKLDGIPSPQTVTNILRRSFLAAPSTMKMQAGNVHDNAIILIQSWFRGYRLRKELDHRWQDVFLVNAQASHAVTDILKYTYSGFSNCAGQSVFFIIFVLMVHFQLYVHSPTDFSMESTLKDQFERVSFGEAGYSIEHVTSIGEIFDYIRAFAESLHAYDPNYDISPLCRQSVQDFCDDSDPWSDASIPEECFNVTEDSGFIDPHVRVQFAMFLVQTRFKTTACQRDEVDPYRDITSERPYRLCISTELDKTFENSYLLEFPDTNVDKSTFSSFVYSPIVDGFMTIAEVGPFNTGPDYFRCKMNRLEEAQWLDERTSTICVSLTTANRNAEGRYGSGTVCFVVDVGGAISHEFVIGSSTLFDLSDQTDALVLFGIFATLSIVHTVMFMKRLCHRYDKITNLPPHLTAEKRWDTIRTRCKTQLLKKGHLFGLLTDFALIVLFVLIIVVYIMLLVESLEFTPNQLTLEMFRNESLVTAFVEDNKQLAHLVSTTMWYRNLCAGVLVVLLFKLVMSFDFHPDIGTISRTLQKSGRDLLYFFLVFVVILMSYAYVAMMLIGDYASIYSTWAKSMTELLFVALGEMEESKAVVFDDNILSPEQLVLNSLFFWSYVFFMTLILFNVLLSIIVDAYINAASAKENVLYLTLFRSFMLWWKILVVDVKLRWGRLCGGSWGRPHKHAEQRKRFGEGSANGTKGVPESSSTMADALGNDATDGNAAPYSIDVMWYSSAPGGVNLTFGEQYRELLQQVEREADVRNFPSMLSWIKFLRHRYNDTKGTTTLEYRLVLRTAFDDRTADKLVHLLRQQTIRVHNDVEHTQNRVFKMRAGDVEYHNYKLLKTLYAHVVLGQKVK